MHYSKNKKCKICGIKIVNVSTYCSSCWHKYIAKKGKNFPKCCDCGKTLSTYNSKYKSIKRCRSCESKKRWKNQIYRENQIKKFKTGKNYPKCIDCGKELPGYHKRKRCRTCNYIWIKKSGKLKGKNNGMYIDGQRGNGYPSEFNIKLKNKIFKRDNYTCQLCGIKGCYLTAHHIDYNKNNCKKKNLITLCRRDNLRVNTDRDYWFAYFMYKIGQEINL